MLAGGAVALADTRDHNLRRLRAALPERRTASHPPAVARPSPSSPATSPTCRRWEGGGRGGGARLRAGGRRRVDDAGGDRRRAGGRARSTSCSALAERDRRRPARCELAGRLHQLRLLPGRAGGHPGVGGGRRPGGRARCAAPACAVERVSGGNSSLLWLLAAGERLPAEVTELRCGEALLLGQDALHYRPLPGCRTDACVLGPKCSRSILSRARRAAGTPAGAGHRQAGSERGRGELRSSRA